MMAFLFVFVNLAASAICLEAFNSVNVAKSSTRRSLPFVLTHQSTTSSRSPSFFGLTSQLASDASIGDPLPLIEVHNSSVLNNEDINHELALLCKAGNVKEALKLLSVAEENIGASDAAQIDEMSYGTVIQGIANNNWPNSTSLAEELFLRMKRLAVTFPACAPKRFAYNAVIFTWSKTFLKNAGPRCHELLNELWGLYNRTDDLAYLPMKSSYISTLSAWARCGRKREAAQNAEALLEEMERYRSIHPHLAPTTFCVDAVL